MSDEPVGPTMGDVVAILEGVAGNLASLARRVDDGFAVVTSDIGQLKTDVTQVRADVAQVRADVTAGIGQLRADVAGLKASQALSERLDADTARTLGRHIGDGHGPEGRHVA